MKRIAVVILVLALLAASVPAWAGTEYDREIVGDTMFARPLGVASIAGGAALWVVSLPFAVLTGSLHKTTQTLIVITSYSIHYTKLYELFLRCRAALRGLLCAERHGGHQAPRDQSPLREGRQSARVLDPGTHGEDR